MNNSIIRIGLGTLGILAVPLIAMQFYDDMDWSLFDFIIMGALIFTTGLLINLVMTKAIKYRVPLAVTLILVFLWLWVELAVGLFTNWGS